MQLSDEEMVFKPIYNRNSCT